MTEQELTPDDIQTEKDRIWGWYGAEGPASLVMNLSFEMHRGPEATQRLRTVLEDVLKGPNVEGKVREILWKFLCRIDNQT